MIIDGKKFGKINRDMIVLVGSVDIIYWCRLPQITTI